MTYRAKSSTWHGHFLIWLAWGPRRVSSRAIPGTEAYPSDVTATRRMWLSWIKKNLLRHLFGPTYIVVSTDKEGHGERYRNELSEKHAAEDVAKKRSDMEARLPDLQRRRNEARATRDFATADAIRAEIEAAGFQVNDSALNESKETQYQKIMEGK